MDFDEDFRNQANHTPSVEMNSPIQEQIRVNKRKGGQKKNQIGPAIHETDISADDKSDKDQQPLMNGAMSQRFADQTYRGQSARTADHLLQSPNSQTFNFDNARSRESQVKNGDLNTQTMDTLKEKLPDNQKNKLPNQQQSLIDTLLKGKKGIETTTKRQQRQPITSKTVKNQKLVGIIQSNNKAIVQSPMSPATTLSSLKQDLKIMLGNVMLNPMAQSMNLGYVNSKQHKKKDEDLRETYIEKYGVRMDLPGFYQQGAKIVPHSPDHFVATAFLIIPNAYNSKVQTTYLDNTYDEQNYDDLYSNYGKSILIRLVQENGRFGFIQKRQVQFQGLTKSFIKFSTSGNYFALMKQIENQAEIYSSRNLNDMFDKMEQNQPKLKLNVVQPEKFGYVKRVIFDSIDNYIALVSVRALQIFSVQNHNLGEQVQEYHIDLDRFNQILDVQLDSRNCEADEFKCTIACKRTSLTSIEIFDINEINQKRQIDYKKNRSNLLVQISDDSKRVLLSNGEEHYMHNGKRQVNFPMIKDKQLRATRNNDKGFYIVISKQYDRNIDILNSREESFAASIPRMSEPGMFKIFDTYIVQPKKDDPNDKGFLKILSKLGDYIYYDTIDLNQCYNEDPESGHVGCCIDKFFMAQSFNWPYFSFSSKLNFIFILNAFNPRFVQRYELPEHVAIVQASFLTDTHDYYCIIETKQMNVEIYHIDMDSLNPVINGPIFSYPLKQVNNDRIVGFHARASSHKEKINLNKQLIIYIMHGTTIYSWTKGSKELVVVSERAHNLYYLSDDQVFFMQTTPTIINNRQIQQSKVFMIQSLYKNYRIIDIYQDRDIRAEILNFGVDNTDKVLIVLSGIKNAKERRDKFVTLFDIEKQRFMVRVEVTTREIIGRLKSNLYNFVGGHIYYGNNTIKVRYDQLKNFKGAEISEDQLFDYYKDILHLKGHAYVQSGMPMQTCEYNRLAYIFRNEQELKPRQILILPYLHERKIICNRRHSANQFYTLYKYQDKNYILCLCLDANKMYVYSETGKLIDRILYQDIADQCGQPQCISEDGQNLVFRISNRSKDLYLVKIYIDQLKLIRKIDIVQCISSYIHSMSRVTAEEQNRYKMVKMFWRKSLQSGKDLMMVRLSYCLNDAADILVRIYLSSDLKKMVQSSIKDEFVSESEDEIDVEKTINHSLYYYSPGTKNSKQGSYIFYDRFDESMKNLSGVSMNERYIFFWNLGSVWKLNLTSKKIKKMSLYISEKETLTFIKQVSTGSDQNTVCIRIEQSPTLDFVIYWDVKLDREIESFDVDQFALLFQDRLGHTYIAEKDYIYICNQGCKIKCFNMMVTDFDMESVHKEFTFAYGHRMEEQGFNYLIMRNYINLPVSYMTFVIKDLFDKQGYVMDNYLFDIEGYDFILDKETLFTKDDTLVTQDFDKLKFILKNFEQLDINLIESLHFMNGKNQLPLHIAVQSNNHLIVNLLLKYMSMINYAAVRQIRDIFSELINYQMFEHYLQECPFQKVQMINKQTLKIKSKEDDMIAQVQAYDMSYVDDEYFMDQMGEDQDNEEFLTFAVEVYGMRADWIVNEELGIEFLQELLKQQRIDLFMTRYVQILIQFLYNKFSKEIKSKMVPPFIAHILSVIIMSIVSEVYRKDKKLGLQEHSEKEFALKIIFQILSAAINLFNLYYFIQQLRSLKFDALKRLWTFIDLIIFCLNITLTVELILIFANGTYYSPKVQRTLEALTVFFMSSKSLYYLKLNNEIEPLINIMIIIMVDIKDFMYIYLLGLATYVFTFWIVGQNQVEMLEEEGDKKTKILYSNIWGAIDSVYQGSLGSFSTSQYWKTEMAPLTVFLYITMSFFMCIHLLNMLIALMGQSFADNQEVKEQRKKMSQLTFIIDNWFMNPIKHPDQVVYLVAALTMQEHPHEEDSFALIKDNMNELKEDMGGLKKEQGEIKGQLQNVLSELALIQKTLVKFDPPNEDTCTLRESTGFENQAQRLLRKSTLV